MSSVKRYRSLKFSIWGLSAVLLAVMTAPILFLYAKAVLKLLTESGFAVPAVNIGLFFRSLLLTLESTLLCAVMGFIAALFIWGFESNVRSRLIGILVICALIPHFIHVHSWIKAVDLVNSAIQDLTPFSPNFTGRGAVIWTTAISYLPFTAALTYLGFSSVPAQTLDMIKTEDDTYRSFSRIILPYSAPFILTGMIFVFLITINDFAIPSVFGVSVYALELFALFSAGSDIYSVALAAAPLMILSVVLLAVFLRLISRGEFPDDFSSGRSPYRRSRSGGAVLVVFAGIPAAAMIVESLKVREIADVLSQSAGQITYSFLISVLTAFTVVIPAALYSYLRSRTGGGKVITILLSLPFLIPSAILGLSLISFWNTPLLSALYMSPVMPAIGLTVRFGILAILFMSYRFARIDREISDSLRLDVSAAKAFFSVVLPMMLKDITACLLLVFALAMGEYGVVLLITPPGYQMMTIKIYNYIHYGASEIVFALNMTILAGVLVAGILVMRLYKPKGTGR